MNEPGPMEQWAQTLGGVKTTNRLIIAKAREQDAALAAKDARIAELAAALTSIANGEANTDHQEHCHRWRKIARAALAPKEAQR